MHRLVNSMPINFDRKKPLAANTMRRIARGIERFVVNSATPFIVKCNHTSNKTKYDCFRGQSLNEPTQTITKSMGLRSPRRLWPR
jgi:DNA (cytosine-5)-methyltransferase 1